MHELSISVDTSCASKDEKQVGLLNDTLYKREQQPEQMVGNSFR